jgi:methionyl aminopeptidase
VVAAICKKHWVLAAFHWFHWYPSYSCINVNDIVVHWIPRKEIIFKDGDLVTFDFWVKDKKYWVNTDAAFSIVIGWDDKNLIAASMIEANKKALYAGIKMCRAWNTVWDVWSVIQAEIEDAGFHIIRDLTGHGLWKTLHEKPYMYNYGKPGTGERLKKWMILAIEPIIGETSGHMRDSWDWEIFVKDGSLWCQYEHTILITDGDAEIIV